MLTTTTRLLCLDAAGRLRCARRSIAELSTQQKVNELVFEAEALRQLRDALIAQRQKVDVRVGRRPSAA